MEVSQKVGLWNMKTKIYQTIKGLIILFIKLQFSNQVQQAFRLLRISTSNIDLNLSLNSNGLIICIIPDAFVSSLIHFMILDVCQQRSLYIPIKGQVQAYISIRPKGTLRKNSQIGEKSSNPSEKLRKKTRMTLLDLQLRSLPCGLRPTPTFVLTWLAPFSCDTPWLFCQSWLQGNVNLSWIRAVQDLTAHSSKVSKTENSPSPWLQNR